MQTVMLAKFAQFGRVLAATTIIVVPLAGGHAAYAQEAATEAPSAKPAGPKEEAVEKPDFALLFRALKQLTDSSALGYSAQTTMQMAAKGVSVLGNQKLDLVALRDKKLRSDVSLWLGDDPKDARKYLVVSDGGNLYTQRAGKNEYSVKLVDGVKFSDEMGRIGILGALYYNTDIAGFLGQTTPENMEQVLEQIKAFGIEITGSRQGETPIFTVKIAPPVPPTAPKPDAEKEKTEVNGADVKAEPAKTAVPPSLLLRFWVDPDTAQFRQLQVQGQDGANRMTLTEKIVRQTNRPVFEAPAFRFKPSTKDAKVADVPVDLFKE